MRVLIVSDRGDSAGLAVRLRLEGHEVYVYFKKPRAKVLLKGLINQVSTITSGVSKSPDIILFDMVGMGKVADRLRQEGWAVIGGGAWNDRLELDRRFAVRAMETFGIRAPTSYAFDNFLDAAKYLATSRKRLVFKPSDNKNTSYTYIGQVQDETIAYITHLKKHVGVDGKCVLQEYIKGTEVSTEVWFAKGHPVPYPNSTIETKRFLRGDLGPSTGCQSSLVWAYQKKEPKIVQQGLKKMMVFMEKTGYSGPIDLNGIVRKGRFYGLEFSPRLGYSAIYALLRLLDEPFGNVLLRLSKGDTSPLKFKPGFGYSLRVSVPPYPSIIDDDALEERLFRPTRGMLVGGLSKEEWSKSVFPMDIYGGKAGLFTAGYDGVVCECTGYGLSPFTAQDQAEELFRKVSLPNKMARMSDPARIASTRLAQLSGMNYEVPPPPAIEAEMVSIAVSPGRRPQALGAQ